ncbi:uncharacterized protein NPIL_88941 [Nephila pilipes]|uniref:Mutator-like transposase domain-containing protein n=1 Tax=Nephila pilipes TaxID=299642 RepID=A0A8X6UET1_NEPPI|nr:uncharacterized protein NPIL_88941 [Nephila pilipes]
MRCIGKGAESAVMFCGIMNLPPPPTKFNNILLQAARETCEESMAEAVHEAVEENDGARDIAVAVDGSWQKRGFSSKNGVVTVTSVDTELHNKVLAHQLTRTEGATSKMLKVLTQFCTYSNQESLLTEFNHKRSANGTPGTFYNTT